MAGKKKDGFFTNVNKFFQRVQSQDLVKLGDKKITPLAAPATKEEMNRKAEFSVFRQYLQQKNWSTRHQELFGEYRKMDESFPIISAALRLYCHSLDDTKIPLLNGEIKTLRQLIDENARDFYVWAYDTEAKKIIPAKAEKVVSTGFKKVLKLTLDDGTIIKCTPDHKHLLKNGEWVETQHLQIGDSLRSIYERKDKNGYLELSDGDYHKQGSVSKMWEKAHQIVANEVEYLKEQKSNLQKDKFDSKKWNTPVYRKELNKVNHIVVSVIDDGEVIEVGDIINAGKYHNFAIKCDDGMMITHNSQEVCLSGDTIIRTPAGDFSIKQLYYERGKNKDFFMTQSYNPKFNIAEWNVVNRIKSNGIKKVFKVTVERNIDPDTAKWDMVSAASFKCTSNHKIMLSSKGDFKELKDLKAGDYIFGMYKWIDPTCRCKRDRFTSAKILSIEEDGEEEVFDLINAQPSNHFSIKLTDSFYVEVHNCTKDTDGNVLKITTSNNEIKESLNECFFDYLKMNTQAYLLAKEMMKFGNLYCFLNTRRGIGVTDLILLPPEAIRIQLLPDAETLDAFRYDWLGMGGSTHFEPWELVHWRNIEDIELQPYGTSILRSIVDTWRRIVLMREALIIYRITRAPQRYLFKIDTSGMDADAALKFADEMKKQLYKKPMVNPATGEIDFKYSPMPISAATPIPLLDGTVKTIKELADDYDNGIVNYVYSIKDTTHEIVAGKVKWCGKNYTANKLIRVWLDNDSYIDAAPEHPFMRRNGERVRADELKAGDSLMPAYMGEKNTIYNPKTGKFESIIKLLNKENNVFKKETIKYFKRNKIDYCEVCKKEIKYRKFTILEESGKLDLVRTPQLLNHKVSRIEVLDDVSIDVYCATIVGPNDSDDRHNFGVFGLKVNNEITSISYSGSILCNSVEENFYMPTFSEDLSDIRVLEGASNLDAVEDYKIIKDDLFAGLLIPKSYLSFEEDLSNKAALCLRGATKLLTNEGVKEISQLAEEFARDPEKKAFALSCNRYGIISSGRINWCKPTKKVTEIHRVTVNQLITIDATGNHPFLLEDMSYARAEDLTAGLRLKGIYEGQDFIVSGVDLIKLETEELVYDLEVEEYHNFALEAGIFVHNSQEDLRFAGAIKQYQSYFVEGLLHIALVHLHINGFSEEDLGSFEIEMNTNSTLAEKTRNELLQQRIDLAKSALDDSNGMAIMSYTHVFKEILKFTDDEIAKIFKDQLIEKKIIWRLNQLKENGFYDEPEQEKKRAVMKGLNADQDVFSAIHFESALPEIKSILTEKLDRELSHLLRPTKIKASKKMVESIISASEFERNEREFLEKTRRKPLKD